MPRYRTFQTSFTSGEFDQKLRDRTDIRSFFEGAQLMRNFALLSQGGFTRRCGTFLLAEVNEGRIIPFEYAAQDALIVNLEDGALTVFDLLGATVDTINTAPWALDVVFDIKYIQRGNSLILAHQSFPPQVLTRNPSDNSFTLAAMPFFTGSDGISTQPFNRKNIDNTITFTSGSLSEGVSTTITASADYFTADYVGTVFRLEDGYAEVTAYTSPTVVTVDQAKPPMRSALKDSIQCSNGSAELLVTLGAHNFSVGQSIIFSNFLPLGGLAGADINGTRTVAKIINTNTFTITADANATSDSIGGGALGEITFVGPTSVIREQAFSPVNGYPGAVCIHEERLWFGGTIQQPDTLWGSVTAEFDNFDINQGLPTDAMNFNIESGSVNEIRHIVSSRHLQVLTNENEFYAPSSEASPLTPETFVIRKQTPFGSSQVRASLFDGATIFVQESGRSVREFLYTDREFAYNARNIALLSQHLIEEPKDLQTIYGGLTRPEQYAFFLNSTGTLAVLHAIRSEEIIGWAEWSTMGIFDGIVVVGQRVFCVRLHESGTRYLEEFDFQFNYFMDGIIGFENGETPTNTWGPAPEYANTEVAVTSGGYFLGYVDVDGSGNFETTDEYLSVEIGQNFIAHARTMQAAFALPDGPMTGMPLRLTRAVVDFGESNTLYVDGQRLIIRTTEDTTPFDQPLPFDTKHEFWLNTISRNPSVDFISDIPLTATVYSVLIEVAF